MIAHEGAGGATAQRAAPSRGAPVRAAAVLAGALLAGSAIAHATAGDSAVGGPTVVAVGTAPGGIATGFTVAPGRVVTVAHVLDGGTVAVRGPDGVARRGTVLRRDAELDLALVAVAGLRAAPAPPAAGTRVLVRRDGRVAALPARVLRTITARVRRAGAAPVARRPALELATRTGSGDSGAPVLRDGRVAGIVFAQSRIRPGVAYAVDGAALAALLR